MKEFFLAVHIHCTKTFVFITMKFKLALISDCRHCYLLTDFWFTNASEISFIFSVLSNLQAALQNYRKAVSIVHFMFHALIRCITFLKELTDVLRLMNVILLLIITVSCGVIRHIIITFVCLCSSSW
jgi:signal transduction histidine kinase